jgi:soluble lytic murein transglycosylase
LIIGTPALIEPAKARPQSQRTRLFLSTTAAIGFALLAAVGQPAIGYASPKGDTGKPDSAVDKSKAKPGAAVKSTAAKDGAAKGTDGAAKSSAAKTSSAKPSPAKAPAKPTGTASKSAGTEKPKATTKPAQPVARNPSVKAPAAREAVARPSASSQSLEKQGVVPESTRSAPAVRATAPAPRRASPVAVAPTSSTSREDRDQLERVFELVRKRKPADATQVKNSISDPVAQKLAEWMILRSDGNGASVERYRAFISANPGWPSVTFLRRRVESALWDDNRDDATVTAWFANEAPLSAKGKFVLAKSLLARGDRRGAERLVRDAWHDDAMSKDVEGYALEMFGSLLTATDHKRRMDYLLFTDDTAGALRAAQRVGAAHVAIVRARTAVDDKSSSAKALLDAVPAEAQRDPSYLFGRIQHLRRADKIEEAAQLMMRAPNDESRLGNPDEWWIERRLLVRKLLDANDPRSAYVIARDAGLPAKDIYKTEQEFTAGWVALRYLRDPSTALQHFQRIGLGSNNPTALARAGYWQGRAYEALGRTSEARTAYQSGAAHSTSYYGQLARAKLGLPQIALREPPGSRTRGIERFEVVRALELLYALDERDLAATMLSDLGDRIDDVDALTALAETTSRHNDARGMLIVGKGALNRGHPFDYYAYPVSGIPSYQTIGPEVEKGLVFAIARQESAFNPRVISPAKAMGLMQVTPAAARTITRRYGATFDQKRLLSDTSYNAMLGAAELGALVSDYRGSYILTFVGYNAGRGRVRDWIAKYGDPRDPNVDAVDWVERIPFAETRNYVQRIMENVQVYRARFGGGSRLLIEADLKRGATVAEN